MSCCCPSLRYYCRGRWRVSKNESSPVLQDLLLHPTTIDEQLNTLISDWQVSILDYENLELSFLEESEVGGSPSLQQAKQLILEMKKDPKQFLKTSTWVKTSPLVHDLTLSYIKIQNLQSKLPVQRDRFESIATVNTPSNKSNNTNHVYNAQNIAHIASNEEIYDINDTNESSTFLHRLSSRWSQRLNEIDATEGGYSSHGLVSEPSASESVSFRLRPRWPRYLTDRTFDVIKVNKMNQKMRRVLKLTQHHVISLKETNDASTGSAQTLTKFYPYRDIRRAYVTQQQTTLKIVLRNGKINTYLSPIALHLFQQIVTRVKIRRALDTITLHDHQPINNNNNNNFDNKNNRFPLTSDALFSSSEDKASSKNDTTLDNNIDNNEIETDKESLQNCLSFTPQSTAAIIATISDANNSSADEVLANFARDLRDRTLLNLKPSQSPSLAENEEVLYEVENEVEEEEEEVRNSLGKEDEKERVDEEKTLEEKEFIIININDNDDETQLRHPDDTNNIKKEKTMKKHKKSRCDIGETHPTASPSKPLRLTYPEDSAESIVQRQLRDILSDKNTPEGSTLSHFLKQTTENVQSLLHNANNKNSINNSEDPLKDILLKVRHFIDGLHEYCLDQRGFALAALYQQQVQKKLLQNLNSNNNNNTNNTNNNVSNPMLIKSVSSSGTDNVLSIVNTTTATSNIFVNNNSNLSSRESIRFLREHNLGLQQVDEDTLTLLSLVIFLAVEEVVFLSLRTSLVKLYHHYLVPSFCASSTDSIMNSNYNNAINNNNNNNVNSRKYQEMRLQKALRLLRSRSQSQWGIPSEFQSPLHWQSAVFELSGLEHNLTPSVQLQVLTRTVKSIYHEFQYAVLPRLAQQKEYSGGKKSLPCIAADDLVPIFLFVFCQASVGALQHNLQNRDFMWGLCHPDQLRGESGYYLTVYESAIECVLQEEFQLLRPLHQHSNSFNNNSSNVNNNTNLRSRSFSFDERSSSDSSGGNSLNSNNRRSSSVSPSVRQSISHFLRLFVSQPMTTTQFTTSGRNSGSGSGVSDVSRDTDDTLGVSDTDNTFYSNNNNNNRNSNSSNVDNPLLRALRISSDNQDNLIRESFV